MPNDDRQKAKDIIVEIVRIAGRVPTKTHLFKIFYFAHLWYAETEPGYLSNWPIVRMPNGPGIDSAESLLRELIAEEAIARKEEMIGPFKSNAFEPGAKSTPRQLQSEEIDAIRKAVEFAHGKTATELSDLTHEFSNSWIHGKDGEELNIYVDSMSPEEFARMTAEYDQIESVFNEIWK